MAPNQPITNIEDLATQCGPVRLDSAALIRVQIPLVEPFRISSGQVSVKDAVLVRVCAGEVCGWGEASAMPGSFYSPETPESCLHELIDRLIPSVLGKEFSSIADINDCLERLSSNRFARAAIETACWELLARRQNTSLRELFGSPCRPIASGLAVGMCDTEAELISAVQRHWTEGYKRLKVKIKRRQDISVVRAKGFGENYDNDGTQIFSLKNWQYSGNGFTSKFRGNTMIYLNKYNPATRAWQPLSECPFAFYDRRHTGLAEIVVRISAAPQSITLLRRPVLLGTKLEAVIDGKANSGFTSGDCYTTPAGRLTAGTCVANSPLNLLIRGSFTIPLWMNDTTC